MYKRLRPGEYQKMTPKQQLKHRRLLRNRWLNKPGNKAKVKAWNKEYLHYWWIRKKATLEERICKRCGELVFMTGRRNVCDKCKSILSKTDKETQRGLLKADIRKERELAVVYLALNTNLRQEDIAQRTNTYQTVVSKILRKHHVIRRHKRSPNE